MTDMQKDSPYSWLFLTATAIVTFTFVGFSDSMGIIVAVFIEHLNESNAKGGNYFIWYITVLGLYNLCQISL